MASYFKPAIWILCVIVIMPSTLKAKDSVPLTSEEIGAFMQRAQFKTAATETSILSIPPVAKCFENTMRPWNRLGNEILLDFSILSYLAQGQFPIALNAYQSIQELQGFLYYSVILNHEIQTAMMSYAERQLFDDRTPSSYENHMISCVLNSMDDIKIAMIPQERADLERLQSVYATLEKTPFLYLRGLPVEKILPADAAESPLTVFSLNTCFLPGNLTWMHGGVAPWEDRLQALADKILSVDADVVCLQEMHTEDACLALYDALKNRYSHFFVGIGPRPLGFSPATFGLPSGLFVASKFPVKNPQFTPFTATGYQMNYGMFDFTILNGASALGHIYTVHLQSLNEEGFPQIRAQELMQAIEKIQSDSTTENFPHLICGDFNIAWGSSEPGEALIRSYFIDSYNAERTGFAPGEQTCTDYFSHIYFSKLGHPQPIGANLQIIDYALLFNDSTQCTIKTTLVPMNSLDDPENAISDHHGLLTTVQ